MSVSDSQGGSRGKYREAEKPECAKETTYILLNDEASEVDEKGDCKVDKGMCNMPAEEVGRIEHSHLSHSRAEVVFLFFNHPNHLNAEVGDEGDVYRVHK